MEGIRRQYAEIGRNQEAALGGLGNKAESSRKAKAEKKQKTEGGESR